MIMNIFNGIKKLKIIEMFFNSFTLLIYNKVLYVNC